MKTEKIFFKNNVGNRLCGIIHIPNDGSGPCIIMTHGLRSDKENKEEWANRLCAEDFTVLRFDFSGHGESEGSYQDTTITQCGQDIISAMNYMEKTNYVVNGFGLVGHSLGGSAAILAAADKRVKAAVPVSPGTNFKQVIGIFQKEGYMDTVDEWKKRGFTIFGSQRLNYSFYEDATSIKFDQFISKITCPLLIIHGGEDERIPVEQSMHIIKFANEPKKLHVIHGGGHNFTATNEKEELYNEVENWFRKWLNRK